MRRLKKLLVLLASHLAAAVAGFGAGIYALPILIAPPSPEGARLNAAVDGARYAGRFRRDLQGSDPLHWGEGEVYVGREMIVLQGAIAPGPDYKLYLAPAFVETEADFRRLRPAMARVGDVETFENFLVPVPDTVDIEAYNTVIVWCEAFGQFITAARYR